MVRSRQVVACDCTLSHFIVLPNWETKPPAPWPDNPPRHYPDTELTSQCHIPFPVMPNTRVGSDKCQFCMSVVWIGLHSRDGYIVFGKVPMRYSQKACICRGSQYRSDNTSSLMSMLWLVRFGILATSKFISGWVQTCDSAQLMVTLYCCPTGGLGCFHHEPLSYWVTYCANLFLA